MWKKAYAVCVFNFDLLVDVDKLSESLNVSIVL